MKAAVRILALLLVAALALWWWQREPQSAVLTETAETKREHATPDAATSSVRALPPEAPAPATDNWRGPRKREGIDAANLYADAFALFDRLTDEEKAMIRKPGEEVDAEKAAQLFEKIQAIMKLLHAAAAADYCDWGTGEIIFETVLLHIPKAQQLGQLALWAAGYRFATDPTGAIDDLTARARLGHQLSDSLIGVLVSTSFERGAHDLLQQHLGSSDAATLAAAARFIGGSSLDGDLARAMKGEETISAAWWERLARMDPIARGKAILAAGSSTDEGAGAWSSAKQLATGLFFSPSRIAEEAASMRAIQQQASDAMQRSDAEFQSWSKQVAADMAGSTRMARLVLPSYESIQSQLQRSRVERALLTAGTDILQNGPTQIGTHRDPATGGAIAYLPTTNGFELRSPYLVKGKPVSMTFRTSPAP